MKIKILPKKNVAEEERFIFSTCIQVLASKYFEKILPSKMSEEFN